MPEPPPILAKDVPRQFEAIPPKVRSSKWFGSTKRYLGANNGVGEHRRIPFPEYTTAGANWFGKGEHFQGIARIGRHLFISGGVTGASARSQIVVIEMGSQLSEGPWALPEYGYSYKEPSIQDHIVGWIDVDRDKWHAGGIQAADGIVAIPVYYPGTGVSEVRFLDFRDPALLDIAGAADWSRVAPERYDIPDTALHKDGGFEAKAVGITWVPQESKWLLAVWDDQQLHFHFSAGPDIRQGGFEFAKLEHKLRVGEHLFKGFLPHDESIPGTYQSLNLVTEESGDIYLIAGRNSSGWAPTVGGTDKLDLYRVTWPLGFQQRPRLAAILTKDFIEPCSKQMYCYNQQCSFATGCGIYIDDPEHMVLYGASHWLHGGNSRYNFNEYSYS
ncbi:MAG TPA: hypothetical protein QGG47_07100 [Acidobacteriota bacterium]|nr:hypothetical protein [Acidobacteriota bacterium]